MSDPDPRVVLELRVHGVRGTPTESMLGVEAGEVRQVAGDRLTGFYRIADGADPPYRQLPQSMALEAYSWGALTSGVRGALGWVNRVLWLALLPFALINLAFWARTRAGEDSGQARWGLRAVRLSGLLLTVIATLTPCFIAIDLIGWQCFRANAVACPVLPDWLDRLAALSTGRRLAVASLVPLGVVLVLVVLSFKTLSRYEATTVGTPSMPRLSDDERNDDRASVLEHPLMWRGEHRTRRLQRLHIIAALATVVLFSGAHLLAVSGQWRLWPTTVAAGLLLVLALVRVSVVDDLDLEFRERPTATWFGRVIAPPTRVGAALRALPLNPVALLALAVVVAHLVVLWTVEVGPGAQDRDFVGTNISFIGLFVFLTLLHVIVFVGGRMSLGASLVVVLLFVLYAGIGAWIVLSSRHPVRAAAVLAAGVAVLWLFLLVLQLRYARTPRSRPLAWAGAGASVMLGGATMVALLYTSAAVVAAANYLNGSSQSVADIITARYERSPVSAAGEPRLTISGDIRLEGARVVAAGRVLHVTGGTIRADALSRESEGLASYALATTLVEKATLILPEDTTTVELVGSCFGRSSDRAYSADEPCTGESKGFRTAGAMAVTDTCVLGQEKVPCLRVQAAHGRVELAVSDPPQTPLVVPQVLIWTPLMQLFLIVIGALAIGWLAFRYFVWPGAAAAIRCFVKRDVPKVPEQDWVAVRKARVAAGLAHRFERLLDPVGMITSLLALVTIALSSSGRPPWAVFAELRPLATISLYVALLASLGLMVAGAQVRRSPDARRIAGVIWDITTFWPRAAHPFAPPCYAERVVPEIVTRVRWALDDDPGRVVVLSGHSQGSLICAAVLCRLKGDESRIRLLTYGSQIRAIYGRIFPAAAGPDEFGYVPTNGPARTGEAWPDVPDDDRGPWQAEPGAGLRHRLGAPDHWINLVRRSDPLGFRVYSDHDGPFDVPTLEVRPKRSGDPGPLVMTHSGYQHTPEYRAAVARWTGEPFVEVPETVAEQWPLPPP